MCWKFVFFYPWLHDLELLVLELFHLHSSSLWRADNTIFTKLNIKAPFPLGPSVSINPQPSNMFEICKSPPGGLIEDLRYLNLQVYIIALNNMGHCQQYFGLKPTNHE